MLINIALKSAGCFCFDNEKKAKNCGITPNMFLGLKVSSDSYGLILGQLRNCQFEENFLDN
jgi:hypothetical protein